MMLPELQTALCILSVLGKKKGLMRVNKIFYSTLYTVLPDCDSGKSKLHNTEMAQNSLLFFNLNILTTCEGAFLTRTCDPGAE